MEELEAGECGHLDHKAELQRSCCPQRRPDPESRPRKQFSVEGRGPEVEAADDGRAGSRWQSVSGTRPSDPASVFFFHVTCLKRSTWSLEILRFLLGGISLLEDHLIVEDLNSKRPQTPTPTCWPGYLQLEPAS